MSKKAMEAYERIAGSELGMVFGTPDTLFERLDSMVGDIRRVYCREELLKSEQEEAVRYYVWKLSMDCFQAPDRVWDKEAACNAVKIVVWRCGLLFTFLAAASRQVSLRGNEHLIRLACEVISPKAGASIAPDRTLFSRLMDTAESAGTADRTAKMILERLGISRSFDVGREEHSVVSAYGHPVDSAIVRMLDTPVINDAFRALVDINANTAMGQMLASSIPVTDTNDPKLSRIVDDCAETLHIRRPYVVVTNQIPGLNAVTFGSDEEPYIAITSLLAKMMEPDQMRFVIGHECGHIAMGHVVYHTAASALGTLSQWIPYIGGSVYNMLSFPLNAWARRSEITADRAGLICCGNLELAKKTLLQIESAFVDAAAIDTDAYIKESRQFLKHGILRRIGEYGSSHPLTPKRMEALELFTKSKLYYETVKQEIPPDAMDFETLKSRTEDILRVL